MGVVLGLDFRFRPKCGHARRNCSRADVPVAITYGAIPSRAVGVAVRNSLLQLLDGLLDRPGGRARITAVIMGLIGDFNLVKGVLKRIEGRMRMRLRVVGHGYTRKIQQGNGGADPFDHATSPF